MLDFLTVFRRFHVDNDFPISSRLFSNKPELERCHAAADKHPLKGLDKLVHSSPAPAPPAAWVDILTKAHGGGGGRQDKAFLKIAYIRGFLGKFCL